VGVLVVVLILAFGIYTVTVRPYAGASAYKFPVPGPTIVVTFGSPIVSEVSCTTGGTAYVERIPWINSSQPVTSGDLNVRVYEIADGDYIGDPNAEANVTSSNVCGGPPPSATTVWYTVLSEPGGPNLITYTVDDGWVAVGSGASNLGIENGSALTLVSHEMFAGTGRGISVYGLANDSPISGSVAL
jgi:hypothetical protein